MRRCDSDQGELRSSADLGMHVHRDGLPAVGIGLGAEQPALELSKGDDVLVGGVVFVDVRGPAELRTPPVRGLLSTAANHPLPSADRCSEPLRRACHPAPRPGACCTFSLAQTRGHTHIAVDSPHGSGTGRCTQPPAQPVRAAQHRAPIARHVRRLPPPPSHTLCASVSGTPPPRPPSADPPQPASPCCRGTITSAIGRPPGSCAHCENTTHCSTHLEPPQCLQQGGPRHAAASLLPEGRAVQREHRPRAAAEGRAYRRHQPEVLAELAA